MPTFLTFKACWLFFLLTIMVLPIGCTHYYVPTQHPVTKGMVPDFSSISGVAVTNTYTSGKMTLIGTQGVHKWMGDMQLWTDTAVGVLEKELQLREINTEGEAAKELKLTVTHANTYWGFTSIRCILFMKVETGEGYENTFEGNNSSPWTLYRACDGAVTRAVEAMLNDDKILQYIKY